MPAVFPALRMTFVAPTFPLPTARTSPHPEKRATRKLKGTEPMQIGPRRAGERSARQVAGGVYPAESPHGRGPPARREASDTHDRSGSSGSRSCRRSRRVELAPEEGELSSASAEVHLGQQGRGTRSLQRPRVR